MSINGQEWQKASFDEAHKMCINKDLKCAVAHPSCKKRPF